MKPLASHNLARSIKSSTVTSLVAPATVSFQSTVPRTHSFTTSCKMSEKYAPARRVFGQKQDVWSIVNEAATASPKQPIGKSQHNPKRISHIIPKTIMTNKHNSKHGTRFLVSNSTRTLQTPNQQT